MRRTAFISLALLLLTVGACRQNETASTAPAAETAAAANLSPEQLGELGAQIQKEPDRAKDILSAHGLTEESFETAIRQVTQDPEASKRYSAAFNKPAA